MVMAMGARLGVLLLYALAASAHTVEKQATYPDEQIVPVMNENSKRVNNVADSPGPQNDVLDTFTLGARRPASIGEPVFGKNYAYNCTNGVSDWQRLGYDRCVGSLQSPIDIRPDMVGIDTGITAANILQFDMQDQIFLGSNQYGLNFSTTNISLTGIRSRVLVDPAHLPPHPKPPTKVKAGDTHPSAGMEHNPSRSAFELLRVDIRTPSEHLINSVRFGVEFQLHFAANATHPASGPRISVAVLGRGTQRDHVSRTMLNLDEILQTSFPYRDDMQLQLNPALFLPRLEGFWAYEGSETAPPCNEGVTWVVMQHALNVTTEFIDQVTGMVNDVFTGGNARTPVNRTASSSPSTGALVTVYPNPAVHGEAPSETLMTSSSASLSKAEAQRMNSTKAAAFYAAKESNVVDMARGYSAGRRPGGNRTKATTTTATTTATTTTTTTAAATSAMDWSTLVKGWSRDVIADEPLLQEINDNTYVEGYFLSTDCPKEYTWANRFTNPKEARNMRNNVTEELPKVFQAPAVIPGHYLLSPLPTLVHSVSAVIARHQGVEQATQPMQAIIRPARGQTTDKISPTQELTAEEQAEMRKMHEAVHAAFPNPSV